MIQSQNGVWKYRFDFSKLPSGFSGDRVTFILDRLKGEGALWDIKARHYVSGISDLNIYLDTVKTHGLQEEISSEKEGK